MPRFYSWLTLALAAGFLVVASVGFAASTVVWLAFGVSIATLAISTVIASVYRDNVATVIAATLAALISAWTIVASLVFSASLAQTLAFASSLALAGLAAVGLAAHEASVERVVHSVQTTNGKRESHLAAAG